MLRDKLGNRLFRRVEVRIIFPDNIFPSKTHVFRSGPHMGYSPEAIDDLLLEAATQLENLYPWWEFKLVPLAPRGRVAYFVLTFAGYRAGYASAPPISTAPKKEESSTLESQAAEVSTPTPMATVGATTQFPSLETQVSGEDHGASVV